MMHADDLYATIRDRQEELRREASAGAPIGHEPVLTLATIALAWQTADLLEAAS